MLNRDHFLKNFQIIVEIVGIQMTMKWKKLQMGLLLIIQDIFSTEDKNIQARSYLQSNKVNGKIISWTYQINDKSF